MQEETETRQLLEKIETIEIIFHEKNEKKLVLLGFFPKKIIITYFQFLGKFSNSEKILLLFNKESFLFKNEEFLDNLKHKTNLSKYFQVKNCIFFHQLTNKCFSFIKNDIFSRFKVQTDWSALNTVN